MINLALKGEGAALEPLIDQALYSLRLAEERAGPLERCGFGPRDTGEMRALVELLKREHSGLMQARTEAKSLTGAEESARARARRFAGLLRSALADLVASGRMSPVQRQAFKVPGGSFRDSTPGIVAWLAGIEVPLRNIAPELSPLLGGLDVMAEHEARLRTLRRLQGEQEVTRKRLPERTRALCELKGRLLLTIERMNRAGKRAFQDEPLEARRFGVEMLERGRRARAPREAL